MAISCARRKAASAREAPEWSRRGSGWQTDNPTQPPHQATPCYDAVEATLTQDPLLASTASANRAGPLHESPLTRYPGGVQASALLPYKMVIRGEVKELVCFQA